MPALGEKVNACTARPFSESRSSAPAERLVKKRSVTAHPTDVLATSGAPLLCTAKVVPALGAGLKLAETAIGAVIDRVQVRPVPWQAPPQPTKLAPDAGTAVSVTVVFVAYGSSQSRLPLPQLIPGPVTRPLPVTPRRTGTVPMALLKDAVVFCDAVIVTVQVVEVPLHAPSQPENVAPVSGVAVRVTKVPGLYDSEQSVLPAPQLIPLPVTLPLAAGLTVRVGFSAASAASAAAAAGDEGRGHRPGRAHRHGAGGVRPRARAVAAPAGEGRARVGNGSQGDRRAVGVELDAVAAPIAAGDPVAVDLARSVDGDGESLVGVGTRVRPAGKAEHGRRRNHERQHNQSYAPVSVSPDTTPQTEVSGSPQFWTDRQFPA